MILNKSYSELILFNTFKERFEYLKLYGIVAEETFGYERYLNQIFYKSKEWAAARDFVIVRDNGCDLGIDGHEILDKYLVIHHINPITVDDIRNKRSLLLDPDNLITTSLLTHNALHYGNYDLLLDIPVERYKYDTCPWKKI